MLGTRATRSAPRSSSRRRRARHPRSFRSKNTHRRERAATKPGRARPGENWYRLRTRVQGGTSGRPPVRRSGGRVVSALFFPARRLGAGRPRPLPRVAHHRLGGVARRRLARERRRAGSCAELLRGGRRRFPLANYGESQALRPTAAPATLSGAAVAGKGVHSKRGPWTSASRAARTRSSRSRIGCRASYRRNRLSGKSRPSLRAGRRRRSRGRPSALLDRLPHALAAAAGARRELPQQRVQVEAELPAKHTAPEAACRCGIYACESAAGATPHVPLLSAQGRFLLACSPGAETVALALGSYGVPIESVACESVAELARRLGREHVQA
jgi:hypothetical protein